MNVELLRNVARHIEATPLRLDMDVVIARKDAANFGIKRISDFPPCGTVCCIGGWAIVLSGEDDSDLRAAKRLLDLDGKFDRDSSEVSRLFHVQFWPESFRSDYEAAKTPAAKARIAVARIEHFIATKGAE